MVLETDTFGQILKRYVHGAAVDDPVVMFAGAGTSATERRHLFADHQGSIVSITDASGNPAGINTYDDWGTPGSANSGRFQYTGQAWLPELGMYHYKARVYSPLLGRFLQTDPVGYDDQINLYAYVANDPMNATDPDGTTATWGLSFQKAAGAVIDDVQEDPWGAAFDAGMILLDIANVPSGESLAIIAGRRAAKEGAEQASTKLVRKQITVTAPTRKAAKDMRPRPAPQKPKAEGGKLTTRQAKNKDATGNRREKKDGRGSHFHDKNHNNKEKPNKHYKFPD